MSDIQYDVASAISMGQRDYQEDAIITDFPQGSELGFAVLADGMGGHAAGDIASKIVVTEVFSELKLQSGDSRQMERNISDVLNDAVTAANDCVGAHASCYPGTQGMGATLVAPVLMGDHLYWISVGDSPLFLFRDGKLVQLNEDHSMAPQIDYLVRTGLMANDIAKRHPDRNCLTSVLGGQQIPRIDCPDTPVTLYDGDILIVASDGLQFLEDAEIADLLTDQADKTSAEITKILLRRIEDLADPDQDNVTFCVVKVHKRGEAATTARPPLTAHADMWTKAAPEHAAEHQAESTQVTTAFGKKKTVTVMAKRSETGVSMMYRVSSGRSV